MSHKMIMAAALAAAAVPTAAAAESWRLAASNDGAMMFVDTDSQQRTGNNMRIVVMTVALPDRPGDWDRSVILREIDCRGGRSAMLESSFFDGPRLIETNRRRTPMEAHRSGSMIGGVVQVACGQAPYESDVIPDPYSAAMAALRPAVSRK
jgi:hypothetical protein